MRDYKVNLESILYSYYIKYTKLTEITESVFVGSKYSNCENIDVYIDLYDILKQLYTTDIYANKQFVIVSSIINLAAHIRGFFWSRYQVYARIFLVYADQTLDTHRKFYPNFGNESLQEMRNYSKINKVIETQLEMIQILCAYINKVYYVRKNCDFAIFSYNNIIANGTNIPAILLTKSIYSYQLPALLDNVVIYRPKKTVSEGDISFAVTHYNVLSIYCSKLNNQKAIDRYRVINPQLLSLIMTLTNLPSKRVISLFNLSGGINRVYELISTGKILNKYNNDIDFIYDNLSIDNKIDKLNFKYRFCAIDLVYQNRLYSSLAESKDNTFMIDLNNKEEVQMINNKYFFDNPLDLNNL